MAGNDDLFKGLQMFSQGLRDYHVNEATNDANQQLQQLNSQSLDKAEQLKAQGQIQNTLALRLTGAGADASQIQAATHNLAPSASEQYNVSANIESADKAHTFKLQQDQAKFQHDYQLEQMKLNMMLGKTSKKELKDGVDSFAKADYNKSVLKDFPKIQAAAEDLQKVTGQRGFSAMKVLVQGGMLHDALGRVNQTEFDNMTDTPSNREKFARKMGIEWRGEVDAAGQDFWNRVAKQNVINSAKFVDKSIDAHAKSISDMGGNGDVIKTSLKSRFAPMLSAIPKEDPALTQLKGVLQATPNHPRKVEIENKIRQLERQQGGL